MLTYRQQSSRLTEWDHLANERRRPRATDPRVGTRACRRDRGLKVAAYDNQVQVDSVDTIDVSGYSNTVTYHSGSPKITQSGYDITVKQG